MLIGQIEQEILEGIFWSYRSKYLSYLSTSNNLRDDFQKDEAESIWKLQQPELNRAGEVSQSSIISED